MTGTQLNRLEGGGTLDAAVHLMDRQVVDAEGRLVCKVDDLELAEPGDGTMAVTGLLVGGAALVPRFSTGVDGRLARRWREMGDARADRGVPLRLGLETVESVGSAVRLRVPRAGVLRRQEEAAAGTTHRRVDDLLGLPVLRDGRSIGTVLDVRLRPRDGRLEVDGFVVGRGRPGSLLGYERGGLAGPWLIASVVRMLHRHTGFLPYAAASVDWERGRVLADVDPGPLGDAR